MVTFPLLQCAFPAKAAGGKKKRSPGITVYYRFPNLHGDIPVLARGLGKSCELLRATAVNKDLFLVDLPGSTRVKTICLALARCDIWTDTDDRTGTLYQFCGLEKKCCYWPALWRVMQQSMWLAISESLHGFECLSFKSVCASSCTISVRRTHIACHPDLVIPNWRGIICVSCVNRISVHHVAQNYSKCIIVVQNVMSVFFLVFLNGVFIYFGLKGKCWF